MRSIWLAAGLAFCACSGTHATGSTNTSGATSGTASAGASSTSSGSGSTSGSASTSGGASGSSTGGAGGTSADASSGSTSGSGPAQIAITTALQLDRGSYAPGEAIHATVTYGNLGSAPGLIQRALVTARPPGGTHAGGPYDDFAPLFGPATLQSGGTLTVVDDYPLPASAQVGTWEVYATYQDEQGSYHDGPSACVTVAASGSSGSTGTTGSSGSVGSSGGSTGSGPGGYSVVGNRILDSSGNPHAFHGVARPSLEWDPAGNNLSLADYQAMTTWRANVVRLSLNQDFWLPGAAQYAPTYQATVAQNVAWAEQAGLDVILDLHWSDKGDLGSTSPGQQSMPDANSVQFWSQVAAQYASDPHVLFELYNEPHDVTWDVLIHGGTTPEGWTGHGMQELYDTVRATGAQNLVIVGGLDWAYDLSGAASLKVQGYNIVYNTHPYSISGARPPSDWDRAYGFLTATDPVIATEFGQLDCGTAYVSSFISYADAHGMSWTAWAWWPGGCSFPSIIDDWSYTVSSMGVPIHDALLHY